jgi:hypothetical protein
MAEAALKRTPEDYAAAAKDDVRRVLPEGGRGNLCR